MARSAPAAFEPALAPTADLAGRFAGVLRRGVVVLGAVMLLVLPHLPAQATFGAEAGRAALRPGEAGPATVLWLGLAAWLMPILLAASWAAGGRVRLEQPWLALPAGLFLVGAVVSTAAAADRSAAAVRAAQLAGLWAALFALAQALRTDAERRVVLAALVAGAFLAAFLAACRRSAITPAPPILPIMAVLVVVGLVAEKWRQPPGRGTRPLALVMAAVGVALAAAIVFHPAVGREVLALRHRLDDWQATGAVLRTHWLTGVGLENFGLHCVTHRLPTAPEEIQDPHNLWLSAWSTLGLAGLAAAASLFGLAARGWVRRARNAECRAPTAETRDQEPGARQGPPGPIRNPASPCGLRRTGPQSDIRNFAGWFLATLVPAALVLAWALAGRSSAMPPWLTVSALAATALVLGLAMAEDPRRLVVPSRPLGVLRGAAAAAIAAFLVNEEIAGGFLAPAAAWPLLALVAVALPPGPEAGRRSGSAAPHAPGRPKKWRPPFSFAVMLAVMAFGYAYVRLLVMPVAREGGLMALAAKAATPDEQDVLLRQAAAANPWAWEPAMARGRLWQRLALEAARTGTGPQAALAAEKAVAAYQEALDRVPRLWAAHLHMAECRLAVPGATDDPAALRAARAHLEEAARLYPSQPQVRRLLKDVPNSP